MFHIFSPDTFAAFVDVVCPDPIEIRIVIDVYPTLFAASYNVSLDYIIKSRVYIYPVTRWKYDFSSCIRTHEITDHKVETAPG